MFLKDADVIDVEIENVAAWAFPEDRCGVRLSTRTKNYVGRLPSRIALQLFWQLAEALKLTSSREDANIDTPRSVHAHGYTRGCDLSTEEDNWVRLGLIDMSGVQHSFRLSPSAFATLARGFEHATKEREARIAAESADWRDEDDRDEDEETRYGERLDKIEQWRHNCEVEMGKLREHYLILMRTVLK